jgi:hypothetical protein
MAASLDNTLINVAAMALTPARQRHFGKPNYQAVIEGMRKELGQVNHLFANIDAAIIDLTALVDTAGDRSQHPELKRRAKTTDDQTESSQ